MFHSREWKISIPLEIQCGCICQHGISLKKNKKRKDNPKHRSNGPELDKFMNENFSSDELQVNG